MKKIICALLLTSILLVVSGCGSKKTDASERVNSDISQDFDLSIGKKTIRFDTNGGTTISPMTVRTLNKGPKTTKENSVFVGWYLDQTLTTPVIFPLDVDKDMTIYAKWLRTNYEVEFEDFKIKWDSGYHSSYVCNLTPNGVDLQELSKLGYYVKMTVSYEVYYRKDYNIWMDIGYAGAPEYEIYLLDSNKNGNFEKNVSTVTTPTKKTLELTQSAVALINNNFTLKFSTDNIQNIIYFKNLTVTYDFYK